MIVKKKYIDNNFFYLNRAERSEFVVRQFGHLIGESVLDIGSANKDLQRALRKHNIYPKAYVAVDKNEEADVTIDLDNGTLPFNSLSFDTIVCTDVLEHLERIHHVFDQMLDICRKNIIISLPNAWFDLKKRLLLGMGSGKFYGLPSQRPADRHRWFFNFQEAESFLISNSMSKIKKIIIFPYFNPTNRAVKKVLMLLLPKDRFLNLFSPTIWIYLEK